MTMMSNTTIDCLISYSVSWEATTDAESGVPHYILMQSLACQNFFCLQHGGLTRPAGAQMVHTVC